jgi:hypothetical protein
MSGDHVAPPSRETVDLRRPPPPNWRETMRIEPSGRSTACTSLPWPGEPSGAGSPNDHVSPPSSLHAA